MYNAATSMLCTQSWYYFNSTNSYFNAPNLFICLVMADVDMSPTTEDIEMFIAAMEGESIQI